MVLPKIRPMLPTITSRGSASQPAGAGDSANASSTTVAVTIDAMPTAATLRTSTRAMRRADSALMLSNASALTPNIAPYCPALSPIIDW